MKSVRDLVDNLWSDLELDLITSRNCALKYWSDAVGKKIAARCSVEGFTESTLNIRAFNPAIAMELRYRSSEIIAAINDSAGAELFHKMKVTLRPSRDRER